MAELHNTQRSEIQGQGEVIAEDQSAGASSVAVVLPFSRMPDEPSTRDRDQETLSNAKVGDPDETAVKTVYQSDESNEHETPLKQPVVSECHTQQFWSLQLTLHDWQNNTDHEQLADDETLPLDSQPWAMDHTVNLE